MRCAEGGREREGRVHNTVANSCFLIKKDFPSSALLSASSLRLLNLSYGAYEQHTHTATEAIKNSRET